VLVTAAFARARGKLFPVPNPSTAPTMVGMKKIGMMSQMQKSPSIAKAMTAATMIASARDAVSATEDHDASGSSRARTAPVTNPAIVGVPMSSAAPYSRRTPTDNANAPSPTMAPEIPATSLGYRSIACAGGLARGRPGSR
jgi:hypothetical protein